MSEASNNELGMNEDHIAGSFEWEVEPSCSCGEFIKAVEEKFIFVSNFTEQGFNKFYIMPLNSDGTLARSDGVVIEHCPWCGDKIMGRKLYR